MLDINYKYLLSGIVSYRLLLSLLLTSWRRCEIERIVPLKSMFYKEYHTFKKTIPNIRWQILFNAE